MGTTPAPSPAADVMEAIERLRRLSIQLSRALQAELGASIYQIGVLAAVDDGARHLRDVAEATGQHAPGASRMVARLVRDGLLERTADPVDRRAVVIELTDGGRRQLDAARALTGRMVEAALERMPRRSATRLPVVLRDFIAAADEVLD